MRVIIFILAISFFGNSALAPQLDHFNQLEHPITQRQVLELPRRDAYPKIRLKRALKIAEDFIGKRHIDISSCYLFEARLVSEELHKEPNWRFWWVNVRRDSEPSSDVKIIVTMNGRAHRE